MPQLGGRDDIRTRWVATIVEGWNFGVGVVDANATK
jgi:hypothetical protein